MNSWGGSDNEVPPDADLNVMKAEAAYALERAQPVGLTTTIAPATLRVVPPPKISGFPSKVELMPVAAGGARSREVLLGPLTMREKLLVSVIADALNVLRTRAEFEPESRMRAVDLLYGPQPSLAEHMRQYWDAGFELSADEKRALLGLMVAFEDATGCKFTDALWNE